MSQRLDLMSGPGGTDGPPPRGPLQWSGRVWLAAAVIVMVGALVVTEIVDHSSQSGKDDAASDPPTSSDHTVPPPPLQPLAVARGRRLVGARPLMFSVPILWQQTGIDCSDGSTVITTGQGNGPGACTPHASSIVIRHVTRALQPGDLALRRMTQAPHLLLGRLDHDAAGWHQTLGTIGGSTTFTMTSPRKATVRRIVGSARAIPEGYTVVPNVVGLTAHEADLVLEPVGLFLARYIDSRGMPEGIVMRITTQSVPPSSIIARGKSVSVLEAPARQHPGLRIGSHAAY